MRYSDSDPNISRPRRNGPGSAYLSEEILQRLADQKGRIISSVGQPPLIRVQQANAGTNPDDGSIANEEGLSWTDFPTKEEVRIIPCISPECQREHCATCPGIATYPETEFLVKCAHLCHRVGD